MFKLGVGNDLEISYSDVVWVLKGQRSTLGLGLGYSNAEWLELFRRLRFSLTADFVRLTNYYIIIIIIIIIIMSAF